ncbi:MAG: DMT family transporter [Microscillaceae bacterium]|nr:DMT family transporter [Microscillaceae bacterium]
MKAFLYLFTAAFLWGLNFHLAKVMLQDTGFLEAGFWRYFLGVLVLITLTFYDLPSYRVFRVHHKGLLLVGAIGLFGFNYLFFLGMQYTTAINATLIVSLNPALTLFFSYLILKTPMTRQHISGILLALVGVVYLLSKGNLYNLQKIQFSRGDMIILAANTVFALHHVWVKKYAVNISNRHFTFLTNLICLLCFVLVLPLSQLGNWTSYDLPFWLAAFGIGALGTAWAYLLWNVGVQKIGANKAGIFMNVVPLSGALLAVFFGESLYFYHLWSALLIISGLLWMRF